MLTPGIVAALALLGASPEVRGQEEFQALKSLVGSWQGQTPAGRTLVVDYRLVANDTVLVETWTLAPGRESLTLYFMDNGVLVATHYCPLGNQPRLELVSTVDAGRMTFAFRSATNLPDPAAAHQDGFEMRLMGADRLWRSESYVEGGEIEVEAADFVRAR